MDDNFEGLFPSLPRDPVLVDGNGNITLLWSLAFASLFQALQINFSNEGIAFPLLNAEQIAYIQSLYTPYIGEPLPEGLPDLSGRTVFNSTLRVSQQFVITYNTDTPPLILTAQWRTFAFV